MFGGNYIHDIGNSVKPDANNDPAIVAAEDKGGLLPLQTPPMKGSPATEGALAILGAGAPYGQGMG